MTKLNQKHIKATQIFFFFGGMGVALNKVRNGTQKKKKQRGTPSYLIDQKQKQKQKIKKIIIIIKKDIV